MDKNVGRLNTIIRYCDMIEERIDEFGDDAKKFLDNSTYHDLCSFYISQIGEKIKLLPQELISDYPDIHWRGIAGMRDIIAHGYEKVNLETIWNFIVEEIPLLRNTCESILRKLVI